MDLTQELKEARYVRRRADGPFLADVGQCGFGCDHSKLLNNDDSSRPCYRVCTKFNIRVSDYDSCEYYSDKKLCEHLGAFLNATRGQTSKKVPEKPKKSGSGWLWLLVLLVLVYILIKNI